MAYQKLQAGLAVDVIPSDTINIPVPNVVVSDTTGLSITTNKLIDSDVDFIELNVKIGDTVYNTSTTGIAKVVQVEDANTLVLSANIFQSASQDYIIYSSADHPNQGCVLYVGDTTGGNDLSVVTSSGSEVIFKGLVAGSFIPVQVVRVKSTRTTVSSVLALW